MDSNGTSYHLIYGYDDWGACLAQPEGTRPLAELWRDLPLASPAQVDQDLPYWDEERCELILQRRISQFDRGPGDVRPRLEDRRGAAFDRYGNLYWISKDEQSIQIRSAGSAKTSSFWSSAEAPQALQMGDFQDSKPSLPSPLRLRGLAVTREHYLVAGVLEPPGLLVFDLHGGGAPQRVVWPDPPVGLPAFAPFDMAARSDGGLWILDRQRVDPPLARLWSLNRGLNVIDLNPVASPPLSGAEAVFGPLIPDAPPVQGICPPPLALTYDAAVVVREGDPAKVAGLVAVEALTDQSALLLDNAVGGEKNPLSKLVRYDRAGQEMVEELSLKSLLKLVDDSVLNPAEEDEKPPFSLIAHDFVFLPSGEAVATAGMGACCGQAMPAAEAVSPSEAWGVLILVAQDGNQAYQFAIYPASSPPAVAPEALKLEAQPLYLPMRLFAGRGLVARITNAAARAYYDSGEDPANWVPLTEQKRPRYVPQVDVYTPLCVSGDDASQLRSAMDGGLPDCPWHRLMIEGILPPGTRIDVWSRAADTEAELAYSTWQVEPQPYRRSEGSELPYLRKPVAPTTGLSAPAPQTEPTTWELLFQKARGRYLQIHIRLSGDGRSTPRLRALRAYYPRFSYLENYLPAVYRQDATSASFLERYLANLEGLYTTLEDCIAQVHALFDERTVPAEYLGWLASWFGTVFDPTWDEQRKRLFLAHAAELYSRRGTALELVQAIRLATDPCPSERIFSEDLEYCKGKRSSPVRIVESFRTRRVPAVVFGDPTIPESPAMQAEGSGPHWTPNQGAETLHAAYRTYLAGQYNTPAELNKAWDTSFPDLERLTFPPQQPEHAAQARDWQAFLRAALDFPYAAVTQEDLPVYQDFLARRYGYVQALNQAYLLSPGYRQFDEITLPDSLPESGPALYDWIDFVSVAFPTMETAHHFTVMVPTLTGVQNELNADLLDRVRRVAEVEKPAHTTFTVREYWALFRVGEARLGYDSQIDTGSRLAPVVLDSSYLAQGTLDYSHPWSVTNRLVLGRDRLGPSAHSDDSCEEC